LCPRAALPAPLSLPAALPICGIRSDQHVADPHAVRARTAQRALVEHVAGGLSPLVMQVHLALQVLTRVGERQTVEVAVRPGAGEDRKSTRLNSSHVKISYAVF